MQPPQQQSYNSPQAYNSQQAYNSPQAFASPFGDAMLAQPVLDAARSYGQHFAREQTDRLSAVLSASQLRHFFRVDNSFVARKLALLLFPFAPRDWSITSDSAVLSVNAPDLYVPAMAVLTYVALAGLLLGLSDR